MSVIDIGSLGVGEGRYSVVIFAPDALALSAIGIPTNGLGAKNTPMSTTARTLPRRLRRKRSWTRQAGASHDTTNLDSDNDGVACESLPNGAKK